MPVIWSYGSATVICQPETGADPALTTLTSPSNWNPPSARPTMRYFTATACCALAAAEDGVTVGAAPAVQAVAEAPVGAALGVSWLPRKLTFSGGDALAASDGGLLADAEGNGTTGRWTSGAGPAGPERSTVRPARTAHSARTAATARATRGRLVTRRRG